MSIEETKHLSKLTSEQLQAVHEKWPNPLMPIGVMMGSLIFLMYSLTLKPTNMSMLIGAAVAFVVLTLGSGIFNLMKLSKARKLLDAHAAEYDLPSKELFKEFRKNLKHIAKLSKL